MSGVVPTLVPTAAPSSVCETHVYNAVTTGAENRFAEVGCILSLVCSFFMFSFLITDPKCRKKVRLRMLITLAAFDWIGSFCFLVFSSLFLEGNNGQEFTFNNRVGWSDGLKVTFFLGWVFIMCSYWWTICIAAHVWLTEHNDIPAGHKLEAYWERMYLGFMTLSMVPFVISLAILFWWPAKGIFQPPCVSNYGYEKAYGILTSVYFVIPTLAIGIIAVLLSIFPNMNNVRTSKQYRLQVIVFLWVYIFLTVWAAIEQIHIAVSSHDFADSFMPFMKSLNQYIGFFNTIVWGSAVRRKVLMRLQRNLFNHITSHPSDLELGLWNKQHLNKTTMSQLQEPLINLSSIHGMADTRPSERDRQLMALLGNKAQAYVLKFEHLRLEQPIAHGAFGQIYKGKYGQVDVAVKSLVIKAKSSEEEHQESIRELGVLARLRHPNVVTFYGVVVQEILSQEEEQEGEEECNTGNSDRFSLRDHDQKILIVTELCHGSLDKMDLGLHQIQPQAAWEILTQIAAGMQYLHRAKVVHRDLKMPNVVYCKEPVSPRSKTKGKSVYTSDEDGGRKTFKICDFGLSKVMASAGAGMTAGVGTPTHMSPEVLTNSIIDLPYALDVYSFGILSWCVLSGKEPYTEQRKDHAPLEVLRMIVHGTRPVLQPEWPSALSDLISRCWAQDPKARPTFSELNKIMDKSQDMLGLGLGLGLSLGLQAPEERGPGV